MTAVYVSIGSNIDPETNIVAAVRLLKSTARITALSTFYKTDPLNAPGAPAFYNGAAKMLTDRPPRDLKFGVLREIERSLGRVRTSDKNAPRTIDLDIMVYGDYIICEPDLVIPDPDIIHRPFLATPLLELAPDMVLPGYEVALADVVREMDVSSLQPLPEFTYILRQEIEDES